MENKLNLKEAGTDYLFCFNTQCDKKGDCIRFFAGQNVPDDMLTGRAVFPKACSNGNCKYFKQTSLVKYAYGFEHIYDKVMNSHYTEMRKLITQYLGNKGQYYKYKHGEKGLSPAQQQHIAGIFAKYGYTDAVSFDRYEMRYEF